MDARIHGRRERAREKGVCEWEVADGWIRRVRGKMRDVERKSDVIREVLDDGQEQKRTSRKLRERNGRKNTAKE